ncbi:MAG: serine hydrolase [Candidatus Hydrogenedentota bacterium]
MAAELRKALHEAVRRANAPGAVAYVGDREHTYLHAAAGARQRVPHTLPAERGTIYDLASLTKVLATTTAFMMLVEAGEVALDQPAGTVVPHSSFNRFTFRHLITHTAGLSPMKPWYRDAASLTDMLNRAANLALAWRPGTRRQYSDIGFMILGRAIELIAGDTLDAFCRKRIWQPLGMTRTDFRPPAAWHADCAPTEECRWRNRIVLGEVHDENAYAAGGVCGHAGLFSTAADLAEFCRGLLAGKVLRPDTLDVMCRPDHVPTYPWQAIGWKRDPWSESIEGFLPSRAAIGHTGWTGTSLWIDRDTGVFAILLSNTCHPGRTGRKHRTLRRTFYTAVAERYFYPVRTNTHTGLDRIVWNHYRPLIGKRIALLTNHAALDAAGRPILEVIRMQPEIILSRLYSPEHGLYGQAEAGAQVASQAGGTVPVTSLYGGRKQPADDELRGIELFVIDLQDVGARYYTYAHTMKVCLAACAASRTPVLVLDRPNPVNGAVLEGPLPTTADSPVCWGKVPIRHGMTFGELARFFEKHERDCSRVTLDVAPLGSWMPHFHHHQCELPWMPPSPNVPAPDTALLYVGTCLFEGVNLNEGRGTQTPFHVFGAPWLDSTAVIDAIEPAIAAGIALRPTLYTPTAIAGKASAPRYQDQLCRGIRLHITDHQAARPFALVVGLLRAIRQVHADRFAFHDNFDVLAGGPWLRTQIEAGRTSAEITTELAPALAAFDRARPRLYA